MFARFLILLLCLQGLCHGENKMNRIQQLLPNLGAQLNIEPYIPDNFELVQPIPELASMQYIWIAKGEFEKNLENPELQKAPFIQVLKQNCSGKGNFEKRVVDNLKGTFPKGFKSSKLNWGPYEVISVHYNATGDSEYIAYADLKTRQGDCLVFMLMYPKAKLQGNGNVPSPNDLEFWNDFLTKTRAI